MQFDIDADIKRRARVPHEFFLTNLVGNHILWFVAALGVFNSYWQPLMMVPVVSVCIILYTLWRARQSRGRDDWFVMCHWQLAARRNKAFSVVLLIGLGIALLGWVGYSFLGMQKVAVMALVGGIGLLPVMVSVLVLIVMESDGMHQANSGKIPDSLYERFPNADREVIAEVDYSQPYAYTQGADKVSEQQDKADGSTR